MQAGAQSAPHVDTAWACIGAMALYAELGSLQHSSKMVFLCGHNCIKHWLATFACMIGCSASNSMNYASSIVPRQTRACHADALPGGLPVVRQVGL